VVHAQQAEVFTRHTFLHEPGQERPAVVLVGQERVQRVPVGVDGGVTHGPVIIGEVARLDGRGGAAADGLFERPVGILDVEGNVPHTVAMALHVFGRRVLGRQRGGQDEPDLALGEQVGRLIAEAGLEARVGSLREPVRLPVEVRGLPGVADPELHVVDALEPQRILVHEEPPRSKVA